MEEKILVENINEVGKNLENNNGKQNKECLSIEDINELELLSDKVRRGIPISFNDALRVVVYQESKPKPKSIWEKIKVYFNT